VPRRIRSCHYSVLALVAVAWPSCKREIEPSPSASAAPSTAPARYKPSSEQGILLPAAPGMTAPTAGKRVILEVAGGSGAAWGPNRVGGMYVTEDGLVWSYPSRVPDAGLSANPPCDIWKLQEGSPERYECMHQHSKLRARLERPLLDALRLDLGRVTESERIEWGSGMLDGGYVVVEVPGRGHNGSPLEIAACGTKPAWQLTSPDAARIFGFFRRLRRALGGASRFVGACADVEPRREIAPGVVAWWSYED
jgi:hypothetical protein